MADPTGFLKHPQRELAPKRSVPLRLMDWREITQRADDAMLTRQASRCMDCGVPFCHQGCPLGNLIPEWNDLAYRGDWQAGLERLHSTNNFPEFTGRVCPAPCESACVLGISRPAVTIKQIEVSLIDRGWESGWIKPLPPQRLTDKRVAVVGSGPAGLACAQQLTRAGHTVIVYERDPEPGGLLRYGIPDFKLEKRHIAARIEQMQAEGTRFKTGVWVGRDQTWDDLRKRYDAVVIATGATVPRSLNVPGMDLPGVYPAMDYLAAANPGGEAWSGSPPYAGHASLAAFPSPELTPPTAAGKRVVVVGGGDTGADCIGTAHRQGAASVTSLAIGAKPPCQRPDNQPWPLMPRVFEVQTSHEEGGERLFLANTVEIIGRDQVEAIRVAQTVTDDKGRRHPKPGTEKDIPADLVLVALGFSGPETEEVISQLGLATERGLLSRDKDYASETPGVFIAGDAGRGQSLVVWAIAEGRACAAAVDRFLSGSSSLPEPVTAFEAELKL